MTKHILPLKLGTSIHFLLQFLERLGSCFLQSHSPCPSHSLRHHTHPSWKTILMSLHQQQRESRGRWAREAVL